MVGLVFDISLYSWLLLPGALNKSHLENGVQLHAGNGTTRFLHVGLTVRGSPTPHTAEIAKVLKQWSSHATFCVHGNVAIHSDPKLVVLHQLVKEHHELANGALDSSSILTADGPSYDAALKVLQDTDLILSSVSVSKIKWACSGVLHPLNPLDRSASGPNPNPRVFVAASVSTLHPWRWNGMESVYAWQYVHAAREGSFLAIRDDEFAVPLLRHLLPALYGRGFRVETLSHV
jgi:hypothetical protein